MPSQSSDKVPTGVPGFDVLVDGGLQRDSSTLIIGGAGSGKTIFAIQYLMAGIQRFSENGMYITFEEKKDKLCRDMKKLGVDLASYEKKGQFIFIEYTPEQVKKLIIQGGGIIEDLIKEHSIRRIVIDSFTSFELLYTQEIDKKEAALKLFQLINKWGCTALLTAQDESPYDDTVKAGLEFEVDGIILIYHKKEEGIRNRAIEVLKMRGTKISRNTVALEITEKGITVYPEKTVK